MTKARFKIFQPSRPPEGVAGLAVFTIILFMAFILLPVAEVESETVTMLFAIGFLAMWRYTWGMTNFIRSLIYRKMVFPRWRRIADRNTDILMPSKIYLLITAYKIKTETVIRTVNAAIEEAIACGVPTTIVASIVELQDEFLFKTIFESYALPDNIEMKIVRIPGTGKRDGLAQGFRAISRDCPPADAVVAVIDGDSLLTSGTLRKCAPFFKLRPNLGALTTDECCEVEGSPLMRDWHDLRFGQRHIYMSSISLSKRVMTLTGRMSMFRADIITHPDFIKHMTDDALDHWRLGRFRFLTGDDKSSLYWVLSRGYEQIYVPDAMVLTLEYSPSRSFIKSSTQLMFRWFGNMLRTNARILKIGPTRMPFFVWWAFLDQRISMWTSLSGPVFAVMLTMLYGPIFMAYYLVWVLFIRWIMTIMLLSGRNKISWRYPFLFYYNHIYGSLVKTWVLFRLDRQSWTRQKTKLNRSLTKGRVQWNRLSSHAVHATAMIVFVCSIGLASHVLSLPHGTIRMIVGAESYSHLP
ncbi:MAG: glycosyltransferase [Micavibrio sp.]